MRVAEAALAVMRRSGIISYFLVCYLVLVIHTQWMCTGLPILPYHGYHQVRSLLKAGSLFCGGSSVYRILVYFSPSLLAQILLKLSFEFINN